LTWSYSLDLTAPKDVVRLLLQDTNERRQLLQDEEIGAFLAISANPLRAAALGATTIAGRFADRVDKAVGDLRISLSRQAESYREASKDLLMKARLLAIPKPYAGGRSVSEKNDRYQDFDRTQPYFRTGMHDYWATLVPPIQTGPFS
jgi:hypothetical protein